MSTNMLTISEPELAMVCVSKGLSELRIEQLESGRFAVAAVLNREEVARTLVTYRRNRREWASLDTLVNHMQQKFGSLIPSATLYLHQGVSP